MKKIFKRFAPILLALTLALGSCLTVSAAGSTLEECLQNDPEWKLYCDYFDSHRDSNCSFIGVVLVSSYGSYSISRVFLSSVPFYDASISGSKISVPLYSDYADNAVLYELIYSSGSITKKKVVNIASSYSSNVRPCFVSNYKTVSAGKENDYKAVYSEYASFFPGPAPLVAAVMGAEPEKTLREVILLIPLSILFLAGCLGLRKGLQLLLSILRRA